AQRSGAGGAAQQFPVAWFYIGLAALSLPIGVVTILGAMKMKRRESLPFACMAAVVTLTPRLPLTWFCGVVAGIWRLGVLATPQVRARFLGSKEERSAEDQVRLPAIGLMVAGGLHVCGLLVLCGIAQVGAPELLLCLVAIPIGVIMILGGAKLMRLQSEAW